MILTFGLAIILENAMLFAWQPDERLITTAYSSKAIFLGEIVIKVSNLLGFVLSILGISAIYFFLHRTHIGKAVRATWQEPEGAALQGINLEEGLDDHLWAGPCLVGSRRRGHGVHVFLQPPAHNLWLIFLFLVVIVGGVGSVMGSAAAGLIIGLITGLSGAFFPQQWINVILFGLLMVILLVKPEGLFKT